MEVSLKSASRRDVRFTMADWNHDIRIDAVHNRIKSTLEIDNVDIDPQRLSNVGAGGERWVWTAV